MRHPIYISQFILISCLSSQLLAQSTTFDPLKYVNQLIGTNHGGNVFAGATLPYGMAREFADVEGESSAGFATDGSNITGFSHMHNPSLGNFPLFPQFCGEDVVDNCNFRIGDRATAYVNSSVIATPGYFKVALESGVSAEMTVSEHAALYHFSFPADQKTSNGSSLSPLVLLDLTDLAASHQNATISVDPTTGRMMRNGTFIPSFGSGNFVLHFGAYSKVRV